MHGAELRFVLLRKAQARSEKTNKGYSKDAAGQLPFVHFAPPTADSMRIEMRCWVSAACRASTVSFCPAKPFPETTTSYKAPCGTRTAKSPREFVTVFQRNLL